MEQELFSTQEAAAQLGIKPPAFRMKALRAGLKPAKVIQGKGKPQKFWTAKQIATIAGNARADITAGTHAPVTPSTAESNDDAIIATPNEQTITATNAPKSETDSEFAPPATVRESCDAETACTEALEGKTLDDLAAEANLYTARGDKCLGESLTFYFAAGRRLIEAKKRVGHGNWQNWLADNFSSSADTANNYMKIARRFGNQNPNQFRNLGLTSMIRLAALPQGTEQEFIDKQANSGKPVETQSARDVQKNVKAFKEARATPNNNKFHEIKNDTPVDFEKPKPKSEVIAEEPTPVLSNRGETDEVTEVTEVTHDSEVVSEPVLHNSAKQEETAATTTETVDEPVSNEFKLAAIKTFETWLNYIEVIGSTISETQLNSLLKLCGEYWHELEKQFTYEKKLARIAEHILKSVEEICAQNTELAVKIKLSLSELEQAQENQKK